MGYTKDQLLARLEELQISFACYDHPVVLTVEAQAKYVGHLGGALSKNLFLKDKKNRFYIVSAMVGTTVDLKVLSQRLGLGKGGLRMAPEEALKEILQVPLGCVTPFALVNDSARNVSLLLDQGFKTQECCLFHPLSNDVTISLNAHELDRFLISIGKKPSYIDLEANPSVGKDQPPDLATLVPSGVIVLPDKPEEAVSCQVPSVNQVPKQSNSTVVKAKAVKQIDHAQSFKKPGYDARPSNSLTNVGKLVEEIIDRTSDVMISEISKDSIQQHGEQLGTLLSDSIRKRLTLELESLVTMFKNSAYTEGFHAAIHYQPKSPFQQ